ncbi:glycoside hydrolase family protein [Telmatospirillum sp. J64-1]|uniref:glycoside hydrolase family protein n=1 Tax=Telmatospirillum sp. J64-1 TaxID=2502183 RepID=UPI00115E282E|nr:glycoside hydrolase family protein [Telmatospirillum sp. J64-1]
MDLEPLRAHIRSAEGYRDKPYRCPAGKLTIGYGTNIEQISREEAEWLLRHRLDQAIAEVHRRWPWAERMSDVRRQALYDMAYNMGVPTLAQFRKMLGAMEAGDYARAAAEALDSLWARQVGQRARRIAQMIREG